MGSALTRVLPQHVDTPVTAVRYGAFSYTFHYARSVESRAMHDSGQDYVTLRHDRDRLAFAVCDGVSQSFFGELAARFLGDALVEWLWVQWPRVAHTDRARDALSSYLTALTDNATRMVMRHSLPEGLPSMVREVLEAKRQHGSESTFACGCVDLTVPRGLVAWMGDSRVRLWNVDSEIATLPGRFETAQGWSTRRGTVNGQPWMVPLEPGVWHIAAYTDGLAALDDLAEMPSDVQLQHVSDLAAQRPDNDDRALFDLRWGRGALGHWPAAAPTRVRVVPVEGAALVTWRPMAGVTGYEVELADDHDRRCWMVNRPPAAVPAGGRVRVRAYMGDHAGLWSSPVPVAGGARGAKPIG